MDEDKDFETKVKKFISYGVDTFAMFEMLKKLQHYSTTAFSRDNTNSVARTISIFSFITENVVTDGVTKETFENVASNKDLIEQHSKSSEQKIKALTLSLLKFADHFNIYIPEQLKINEDRD